jgi:peptide/nickel transport system permease protein
MAYFLKRFSHMLFVLWAVATILFFMFRTMPGTPLAAFIDNTTTAEQQDALIRQFGLDKSLGEQYWLFLTNLMQGDLGQSFFFKKPVVEVVMEVFQTPSSSPSPH